MTTRLPDLSHLQFLVLSALHGGDSTGRTIREGLRRWRVRQSGPAFYQMMARLEKAGLVKGWYEQDVIDGQIIKERHYRITVAGEKAWAECRQFYEKMIDAVDGGEGLAHA
jgi:DNA-binding PadR family transcriptional regulator